MEGEKAGKKNSFWSKFKFEWDLLKGGTRSILVILFTLGVIFGGTILLFKGTLYLLFHYGSVPEDSSILFMVCLVAIAILYKFLLLPFGIKLLKRKKLRK